MTQTSLPPVGSLVLHQSKLALVQELAANDRIVLKNSGGTVKVRPKDVVLLHPGPLQSIPAPSSDGSEQDLEELHVLLEGQSLPFTEACALLLGDSTPAQLVRALQLFQASPLFEVQDGQIEAVPQEVLEQRARKARQQEELLDLKKRFGQWQLTESEQQELANSVLKGRQSRMEQQLGLQLDVQQKHRMLIHTGFWPLRFDPYPEALGLQHPLDDLEVEETLLERRDLRHLLSLAIDEADCTDPDDAISWDGESLYVHIADVARFLPPFSPQSEQVVSRVSSRYFPHKIIHMLPESLMHRCRMQGEQQAITVQLHWHPDGDFREIEVYPSTVFVQRLSYLETEEKLRQKELWPDLQEVLHLEDTHHESRPSVKVKGDQIVLDQRPEGLADQLVWQSMVLANGGIADHAREQDLPMVYAKQTAERFLAPTQYTTVPSGHHSSGQAYYTHATSPMRRNVDLMVQQQLYGLWTGQNAYSGPELLETIHSQDQLRDAVRQAERLSVQHWLLVYVHECGWQGKILNSKRGNQMEDLRLPVLLPARANLDSLFVSREVDFKNGVVRVEEMP